MNIFTLLSGKQYNILSNLPEAVLVIDETGKILYANKKAFTLFETSSLRGKNINDYFILHSEHILKNKDNDLKQILKAVTEDKNTKTVDVKVADISSGKNKRYIITVIDNTQDHALLDELIAERNEHKFLNRTKNVLLKKMANYLSSPLHSVVGFSQAMLDGLSGELNEKQRKYTEIINSNTSDVLLLINNLIELSVTESDLYKFEFQNFDAAALAGIVINEMKVKLKNKDIRLFLNTSDLLTQNCYSDKNIISLIISDLLENAVSLIETGSVTLNVSNPEPEFLISQGFNVPDDINAKSYIMFETAIKGINYQPYCEDDVFDPYIQADKNSKKYLLQSMLLATVKKYTEKLKGEIRISTDYSNSVSYSFIIPSVKSLNEAAGA